MPARRVSGPAARTGPCTIEAHGPAPTNPTDSTTAAWHAAEMPAPLQAVAPAFVEMAHRIVWVSVATVDPQGRPRSRVLHPVWEWDGTSLVGWIATAPTPRKVADLGASPHVSLTYWAPSQDTCSADCRAELLTDLPTREAVWERFTSAPEPVGYDPSIIPGWDSPSSPGFAALRLEPWRLRVMPGSVLLEGSGEVLTWREPAAGSRSG